MLRCVRTELVCGIGHLSYDPETYGRNAKGEANDVPSGIHAIVQVLLYPWIGPRVAQIVCRPHAPHSHPQPERLQQWK